MKKFKRSSLVFFGIAAGIIISMLAIGCAGGASIETEESSGASYNSAVEYPVTVEVKFVRLATDSEGRHSLVVEDFASGSPKPTVTASPTKAKAKAKSVISISDVPAGFVVDGGNTKATAGDGIPILEKKSATQYQLTAGKGPNTVTVVFINQQDILLTPAIYDNRLWTAEIEKGEFDVAPLYTAYFDGETAQDTGLGAGLNNFWRGEIAFSGYNDGQNPKFGFTPFPNNTEATATYSQIGSSLQTENERSFFRVKATVTPQVRILFPTLASISVDFQALEVIGKGQTVAEMYQAAPEKDFFFEIEQRQAIVDARLKSVVIMPSIPIEFDFTDASDPSNLVPVKTLPIFTIPFGVQSLEVIASTLDSNATVMIDNNVSPKQTFTASTVSNTVEIAAGAESVSFRVKVKAESGAESVYTFMGVLGESKYATNATGGSTYFLEDYAPDAIPGSAPEKVWEVHSFYISRKDTTPLGGQLLSNLEFNSAAEKPVTVEVLVVAGGGAGGGGGAAGGGGGGGVIHYNSYILPSGLNFPVKVGNGGAVDNVNHPSQNGGASQFGADNETYRLVAPGGGGGGAKPNWDGRAFKGADGGNGGGGACGWNYTGVTWTWATRDDLNGQIFTSGDGRQEALGRALTVNFHYDGTDKKADNVKTYPVDINTLNYPFGDDITQTQAYIQALSTDVTNYQVQHTGHAFGRNGGWIAGISDGSGGSGAGTDAWYHTTAGRNSTNAGGQGIMFNTSGQWRWYSAGGPAGYRCWGTIGQGGNGPGTAQSGNGGAGGNPGGSGTVIVKWEYIKK
ncbi:MAG: hypothetical protein Ta2F_11920 [Termitinemataceae bacterium]|nr:MAG: hypothetical protein Ta2F_11920 [Termitinemataceae bacterium]